MYIVCFDCKYSFHTKCIKPRITKKKLQKEDFEFFCKSCKKKNKGKRKAKPKQNEIASNSHEDEQDMEDVTLKNVETEEKNMTDEKESDKEIVIIQDLEDQKQSDSRQDDTDKKSSCKKFKIVIDPSILHDEDMFGGVDQINQFPNNVTHACASSTILKSKSDHDSERLFEEEMDQDDGTIINIQKQKSSQHSEEMDVDGPQDEDGSIIKITKDGIIETKSKESPPRGKSQMNEDDLVVMSPLYAQYLDEVISSEFWQLEKE